MSTTSSKKVQKIKGMVDAVQNAMASIPALEQIGREIELHLDKLADAMINSFWVEHKKELEQNDILFEDLAKFKETDFWKEFVSFMTDKSQNKFMRNKLSLLEYFGIYSKHYYEKKKKEEVI